MAEPGEPEIFTSENRAEESAWLHARPPQEKSPGELERPEAASEYARMLDILPGHIREATKELSEMRAQGIPDKASYTKVLNEMTGEHNRFVALSERTAQFAEEIEGAYNLAAIGEALGSDADTRIEKQNHAQNTAPTSAREREHLRANEIMLKYTTELDALSEFFQQTTEQLKLMRKERIPDPAAYQKLREEFTRRYEQFSLTSKQMVDIAEDVTAYDAGTRNMANILMQEVRREKLEDAYRGAIEAVQSYGRRETDYSKKARKLPMELYEEEVRKLLYVAAELEDTVEAYAKQGMLEKLKPTIMKEQQDILEKLRALDTNSTVKDQSRERESLIDILSRIDELVEKSATPASVTESSGDSHAALAMAMEGEDESFITSLELYEEGVRKLLTMALELEDNIDFYEKQRMVDRSRGSIRDSMDSILQRLKELDAARTDSGPSRERDSLIDILSKIDERLEKEPKVLGTASPLSESRAAYRAVKAQYAAVQHTLSEDQRRAMRSSISAMNDAVRQAENDAWKGMFARQFEPIPPPEPPTGRPDIHLAIAHATEHAPALATATLASLPKVIATPHVTERRGFFSALSDAFKLR